jgi:hypothetical protein
MRKYVDAVFGEPLAEHVMPSMLTIVRWPDTTGFRQRFFDSNTGSFIERDRKPGLLRDGREFLLLHRERYKVVLGVVNLSNAGVRNASIAKMKRRPDGGLYIKAGHIAFFILHRKDLDAAFDVLMCEPNIACGWEEGASLPDDAMQLKKIKSVGNAILSWVNRATLPPRNTATRNLSDAAGGNVVVQQCINVNRCFAKADVGGGICYFGSTLNMLAMYAYASKNGKIRSVDGLLDTIGVYSKMSAESSAVCSLKDSLVRTIQRKDDRFPEKVFASALWEAYEGAGAAGRRHKKHTWET